MVFTIQTISERSAKYDFEDALDLTGFGKYNISMLGSCSLLILAMYFDIFGFSVVLPAVACDLGLSTHQQGFLSAVPLIGVMVSSYAWGLCADILGRRATLLIAMPLGAALGLAATLAPTYTSLAALKFLSASFTSSANAAAFVLVGESVPRRHRNQFMFLMASATMAVQLFICAFALPVFKMSFALEVSWLSLSYRPWRLLLQIISLSGVLGIVGMVFLKESPKFLLSAGKEEEAMGVLKHMYSCNTNLHKSTYPVSSVHSLEDNAPVTHNSTFLHKMWNQTAPLFQPPLLKNSLKLYYILLCAYMTSTGYTMWVPTMTNAYFNGDDASGKTFCQVASSAASNNATSTDCDNSIQESTLYAVMCYSFVSGACNVGLSFIVAILGKRIITVSVFTISALAGILLLLIKIPLLSIALFFIFLYVALILGNVNTYLVELNPTHLRGMATCLSVVVARGFGFFSVQIIASLLKDHCTSMISGYVVLVISGLVVAVYLPPDNTKHVKETVNDSTEKN